MSKSSSSSGCDNTIHFRPNPSFWIYEQQPNSLYDRNASSLASSPNVIGIDFRETNSTIATSTTMSTDGRDDHEPTDVQDVEEFTLSGPSLNLDGNPFRADAEKPPPAMSEALKSPLEAKENILDAKIEELQRLIARN